MRNVYIQTDGGFKVMIREWIVYIIIISLVIFAIGITTPGMKLDVAGIEWSVNLLLGYSVKTKKSKIRNRDIEEAIWLKYKTQRKIRIIVLILIIVVPIMLKLMGYELYSSLGYEKIPIGLILVLMATATAGGSTVVEIGDGSEPHFLDKMESSIYIENQQARGSNNGTKRIREGILFDNGKIRAVCEGDKIVMKIGDIGVIEISKDDWAMTSIMMVFLTKLRTDIGKKVLIQDEVALCLALSRQWTNVRYGKFKEEGLEGLLISHEQGREPVAQKVVDRVIQLQAENLFRSCESIAEQIVAEKITRSITTSTVWRILGNVDLNKVKRIVKNQIEKGQIYGEEIWISLDYVVGRLFEVCQEALEKITDSTALVVDLEDIRKVYNQAQQKGAEKYETDRPLDAQRTEKIKQRKKIDLEKLFNGEEETDGKVRCTGCRTEAKKKQSYTTQYKNEQGESVEGITVQYECLKPDCSVKTFTVREKGLENNARVKVETKKEAFEDCLHLKGSLRRVSKNAAGENRNHGISFTFTTLLRWLQKAGRELVPIQEILGIRWSGRILIDEKWIKIRNKWRYIFVAVDAQTQDMIHVEVFLSNGKEAIKTFLLQLKSMGYIPAIIVTDGLLGYENQIKDVYPNTIHHECVFHAERSAVKLLRKYYPAKSKGEDPEDKAKEDPVYQEIRKLLRKIFGSLNQKELEENYREWISKKEEHPTLSSLFKKMEEYYPKLLKSILDPQIPRTTNGVERVIKEFEEKYQCMHQFSSFYSARLFVQVFSIYYRFRKFERGRFKGRCPLEIAGYDIKNVGWDDYLFAM